MVSESRSARKIKNESDGHSSKRAVNTREKPSVCRRGNADRSLKPRKTTSSPQGTRKSKRLDNELPLVSPAVDRKSERLEKYNTPSTLRRSDRSKKELSFCSSGSKQSSKEPSASESKRKKEKPLIEVTMESKKAELEQEAVGMKRKKMDARSYRALFKMQRSQEIMRDCGGALDRMENLFNVRSDHIRGIGSDQVGLVGELRDEDVDRASNGVLQKSISTLNGCPADIENDTHVDSGHKDSVANEPGSEYPHTSSGGGNMFDNPEKLRGNCSTTENVDPSESESSNYSVRSQDGFVGSPSSESSMHPIEATISPSLECENCNLVGTCVLCSKSKRVGYDSPEQELCSCSPIVKEDRGCFTTIEDNGDPGAAVTLDSQRDGCYNVCVLCNKDGEFLRCLGKGCKRCYHPYCFDPSLTSAPPGVWHCPKCVKKKLLFGVHSVSDGVESIWDVREVEVSNAKGVWQRQYFVKYHGLAHKHNSWVPEKQLLLENPCLVSNFTEKDQNVRWSAEWMVPHRLLMKRPIEDKIYIASSKTIFVCEYEWLVKWCGLDYDHATWELDNSSFLSSSLGQNLVQDYEVRRQKAKKDTNKLYPEPIVKLPVLHSSRSNVNVNYMLKNVNKLREYFFKGLNTVVFDDQERAITVIYFIQSMIDVCWPFLIVTSGSLSRWEAEFAQLAPSLDVVLYSGSTDRRKGIRASEFYDEEGCMMVQVLLSSVETVSEDIEILRSIKWKSMVIDEYHHSGISNALEQINTLQADMKILLVSGQIKDTTSEYLKILSLIEPHSNFDKLKPETNDSLCKLKERLSRFIAYGRASQASKFIEFWVPVQISNYQLEHYCATLLSNSIPLCSYSRSDRVGALRDILLTVRKCCDHPYLLDLSVQERLVAEQCPAAKFLDIGIKASGKLQLLDMMLTEIKARGLQVLILFQLIVGSWKASTGDILDDFLRQRFGSNTYERIEAGITPSKKQAAINRFNKKEDGQFVLLLENRACSALIKLSSVDVVIIYDSDWNPANDLRAVHRISFDSKVEQIKVFRLYTSFTIEERALVLSKQRLNIDNNLQNFNRATSDTLLTWGAMYLFSKLEKYHADGNSNSAFNFTSEHSLLEEVTKEFQAILSENDPNAVSCSVISEAKLGVGSYSTNIPVHGEAEVQLKDGEEPHVFWKNLFDGKNPKWKHLMAPSPRNRKRVHSWEGSPSYPEIGKDDTVKKRKITGNENPEPAFVQVESGAHQIPDAVLTSEPGSSTIKTCIQSENFQRDGRSSLGAEVSVGAASDERIVLSDKQKSFHSALQGEMTRLCQTLKISEDVIHVVRKFLEYVIKNHHVNSDSPSIVQAFQISVCWIAASITKQKVVKKETLMLAKQLLNYQCTEEEALSVYSKMRSLKRMYLQSTDSCTDSDRDCLLNSDRDCLLTEEDIDRAPSNANGGGSHFSSSNKKIAELDIGEKFANEGRDDGQILVQQNSVLKDNTAASEIDNKIKKIQRKCDKRMKKLIREHKQEIQEFQQIWEKKRKDLGDDHKLEFAFIRSIQYQGSVGLNKLKLLEDKFAKKLEEHNLLKDVQLKELEAKQLAAIDQERLKATDWLAKAKACSIELRAINEKQLVNSQSDYDTECPQPRAPVNIIGSGDASGQRVGPEILSSRGNDVTPLTPSLNATAEAIRYEAPPVEQVSDDIQSVGPSKELQVPNEMAGHVHPGEVSTASNNRSDEAINIASSDDLVSRREEATSGGLPSTGQPSLPSEKTVPSPDCSDLLPQQVQQDETAENLGSAQLQDSDAPAVENQSTSQIEVAISEPVDSVTPAPSNIELPITDDIIAPVLNRHQDPVNSSRLDETAKNLGSAQLQDSDAPAVENQSTSQIEVVISEHMDSVTPAPSNIELPVTDDVITPVLNRHQDPVNSSRQPPYLSISASLSCNQAPANENHDQGRSSSQTVVPGAVELLCQESVLHNVNLDIGPSTDAPHGPSAQPSALLQHDVSMPRVAVSTSEQSNHAASQLQMDAGILGQPTNNLCATQQSISWNSSLTLGDPLQKELEKIRIETEQLEKTRDDTMSKLKADCEKEIEEFISQVRNKYAMKLQETEDEFRVKRNELDKIQNKVLLNKILAEAVRSKCVEAKPGRCGVQQGAPHNLVQHQPQVTLPRRNRRIAGPSGSQPGRTQPITTPQLLPRTHAPRSSPGAIHSISPPIITAQPVQGAQPPTAHFSGPPSRPLVINAISPAGNPRSAGNEIRSIAPHLQPSMPTVASSPLPTTIPSAPQFRPVQARPSQPVQVHPHLSPLPRAPQQPSTSLVTQNRVGLSDDVHALHNPSPTTQRPRGLERHNPALPDISSTFSPLEPSDLEMLGRTTVQGSQTSAVVSDVVCLSDDD